MKYAKLASYFSELFDTHYIVGCTEDGQFVYIWTNRTDYAEADEIPAALLAEPTDRNGALVGSADYIIDDIENCVGGFRDWGTDEQVAEASEIVESLVGAIKRTTFDARHVDVMRIEPKNLSSSHIRGVMDYVANLVWSLRTGNSVNPANDLGQIEGILTAAMMMMEIIDDVELDPWWDEWHRLKRIYQQSA